MKKCIFIAVALSFVCSCAIAQFSMSFGAGGLIDFDFNNGLKDDYKNYIKYRNLSSGGYAYLDATFIELGFSYSNGSLTNYTKLNDTKTTQDIGTLTKRGFTCLLKMPIVDGYLSFEESKYVFFPLMIGFDYHWGISHKNGNDGYFGDLDANGFSHWGFLFGSAVDYTLIGPLYIRGEALFRTGVYKAAKEYAERYNGWTTIGFGFGGKLCLGFNIRYSK